MSSQKKIRVFIVDDSTFFSEALKLSLKENNSIEVIGTANNVDDAFQKIVELAPDVVTLDVEMPKMNGIEFLKQLMPECPLPVIIVSAMPINALDALSAGAVDFVRKPDANPQSIKIFLNELIVKIKIGNLAQVKTPKSSVFKIPSPSLKLGSGGNHTVIAIGASTGGTDAILNVVKDLPTATPPVLIVQHMPPVFTAMYAKQLGKSCKMRVTEAKNMQRLENGLITVAAGEQHMTLHKDSKGLYIKSVAGAKVSGHCPSVDVLFSSVAKTLGKNTVGVILTGMGADGAAGLLEMKKAGAHTIGQNKESCIVYGMPQVAFNIGAVQKQLPLDNIGAEIINQLNRM